MADRTELDAHRGMAAQRETVARRGRSAVRQDQADLRARREEMERHLFASPAADWPTAVDRARYLLMLLADSGGDPRVRSMVEAVLSDFETLLAPEAKATDPR